MKPDYVLDRAPALQRDLAHHHGMWHRTPVPDLLIAETALFQRMAEIRPLMVRRLG